MSRFADVPDSSPFADDIERLAAAGVMVGDPDGKFRPKDAVTREELAAVLNRIAGGAQLVPVVAALTGMSAEQAAKLNFFEILAIISAYTQFVLMAVAAPVGTILETPNPVWLTVSTPLGPARWDLRLKGTRVS